MGIHGYSYNLYDNGVLVLESANPKQIRDFTGINVKSPIGYAIRGHKINGRYTLELADESYLESLSEEMFKKEWNDAIKPFKRVIWVKEGGRKLKVGGKK
jgi:hypothetical protein